MQQQEFDTLDQIIDLISRHAATALLSLDWLRLSIDAPDRDAYRQVHDLMGDLGSMKVQLGLMEPGRVSSAL